ncbi:MAG TPA: class I SAM-dependent methyltransferase [Nocardioidaceae bacterium]|nr:class I SAM-dependent methyltransferase [Nocardioidaceae bacterium]
MAGAGDEAFDGAEPGVVYRSVGTEETGRANRRWWDAQAGAYQDEHGAFLGDADFVWCPEGLREAQARLLGDVRRRRVLEVGCGAGQCGRWLRTEGARVVGVDLSIVQLRHSRTLDARTGITLPTLVGDALALPFPDAVFDVAASAYGAVPFVADSATLMAEVARVLRPGGRWVFATSHPLRWTLPDDPGEPGLVVRHSYFDRTPYVEQDHAGRPTYVEHHRTVGDRVREINAAGLVLRDLVEPEWPDGHDRVWGGWSPLRGRLVPGTAIFVCEKPR